MSATLTIRVEPVPDSAVMLMHVTGNLDSRTSRQFADAVQDVFDQTHYKVVLDLAEVEHIASAGIGVLVNIIAFAQEHDGGIVFINLRESIRKGALKMIGLTDLIRIADDLPSALTLLGK